MLSRHEGKNGKGVWAGRRSLAAVGELVGYVPHTDPRRWAQMSAFSLEPSALLPVLVLAFMVQGAWGYDFAGGTGEPNDPYQIATAAQLTSIGADPNLLDKHYVLVTNIDLDPCLPGGRVFSQAVIAPNVLLPSSGRGSLPALPIFSGTFDGQGFKVRGLTIAASDNNPIGKSYLGLFGRIGPNANVRRLSVTDANLLGGDDVGILVGWSEGNISSCRVSGAVLGSCRVGGLVGTSYGVLHQCSSTGAITGGRTVGGLVGESRGNLVGCSSVGCTLRGYSTVGGLVGHVQTGELTQCSSVAMLDGGGGDEGTGGLVGLVGFGNLSYCTSSGIVRGSFARIGGLIGTFNGGRATQCHTDTVVIGMQDVGGMFGYIGAATVTRCSSEGLVVGLLGWRPTCGGYVGSNGGVIDSCFSRDDVTGDVELGGFVGRNWGKITNSYSTGSLRGESLVGGFAAIAGGQIKNCYCACKLSGRDAVGGFLAQKGTGTITNCFWDTQTSGVSVSAGGTGLTTSDMKNISTFLTAGWDFIGEATNGTGDLWMMSSDHVDYPRLTWEQVYMTGQ